MSTLEALENHFLEEITPLRGKANWQERAWSRFLDSGLPDRQSETYRYVQLRSLYSAKTVFPSCMIPKLPSGAIVLSLEKAYAQFQGYLDQHFARWIDQEKDPLALLGTSLSKSGLFIYLPPNTTIEEPILIHQPSHLVLYMAKGSSMKLRLMRQGGDLGWMHRSFEAGLDEQASLQIQLEPHDEEMIHLDSIRVSLKKDARFKSVVLPSPSSLSRQDFHIKLQGEGSDAKLFGLVNCDKNGQQHSNVLMEHCAPHTTSWQHFKAVLGGRMKHSFEGKIYIHSNAQKVDAYQMHNSLILDERAESKCKPNLEIFADDVKASHGATCGRLDKEALFYLTSRGIPMSAARELLINAFCGEVLNELLT